MSELAKVTPLSSRRSGPIGKPHFSTDDEEMISSLACMLTDEMANWDRDGSARARIYFYFSFHHYLVERWMGVLSTQETLANRQLARQLDDAFQYVTSTTILDSSKFDHDGYRRKLDELADNLRALLLIQLC
jgi:hypothetical protein